MSRRSFLRVFPKSPPNDYGSRLSYSQSEVYYSFRVNIYLDSRQIIGESSEVKLFTSSGNLSGQFHSKQLTIRMDEIVWLWGISSQKIAGFHGRLLLSKRCTDFLKSDFPIRWNDGCSYSHLIFFYRKQ